MTPLNGSFDQVSFYSTATRYTPERLFNDEFGAIIKYPTTCCSLCILSVQNTHTLDELTKMVNYIKEKADARVYVPQGPSGGERNILVIVSPGEGNLEKNLKKLDFKLLSQDLQRRNGYPVGNLKMYLLSFKR